MKTDFSKTLKFDDIENHLAVHGQRGVKTLSIISKKNEFQQAITDPIGQTLMKDLMIQMEILLNKIIDEKADDKDRAEYRVCRKLFEQWAIKIKEYRALQDKVITRSNKQ